MPSHGCVESITPVHLGEPLHQGLTMSTTFTHGMKLISTTESIAVSVGVARSAQSFEAPATGAPIWYKRHLNATRRHGGSS